MPVDPASMYTELELAQVTGLSVDQLSALHRRYGLKFFGVDLQFFILGADFIDCIEKHGTRQCIETNLTQPPTGD